MLGGLKFTLFPRLVKVQPYIQASAGYLGIGAAVTGFSVYASPNYDADYGVLEGLAGLDLPITSRLDLRAIEIGAGHAFTSSDHTQITFVSASVGLVLHFQSRLRKLNAPQ